jgi:hypothetical protein
VFTALGGIVGLSLGIWGLIQFGKPTRGNAGRTDNSEQGRDRENE